MPTYKRSMKYKILRAFICGSVTRKEFLNCVTQIPIDFSASHLKSGWAKRPIIGKMYGPKYIEKFRPDIQELYLFG